MSKQLSLQIAKASSKKKCVQTVECANSKNLIVDERCPNVAYGFSKDLIPDELRPKYYVCKQQKRQIRGVQNIVYVLAFSKFYRRPSAVGEKYSVTSATRYIGTRILWWLSVQI